MFQGDPTTAMLCAVACFLRTSTVCCFTFVIEVIIIIIRWCRVLCVCWWLLTRAVYCYYTHSSLYVVAIICICTRDVILLAVAVFLPQHEMVGSI